MSTEGTIQPHLSTPMHEIEGITKEHIIGFLGLGCHRENKRVWGRKRVLGKMRSDGEEMRER